MSEMFIGEKLIGDGKRDRDELLGSWMNSIAEQVEANRLLPSTSPTTMKSAALGAAPSAEFEEAFASLAYKYVNDAVPSLMGSLVGFELVDRNDDNTKAVGVFVFQVGKSWMYVPVFFLNGELKGHELLYLKDRDQFLPLKDAWLQDLNSKRPSLLGEMEENTDESMFTAPDMIQITQPPRGRKYGTAGSDATQEVLDALALATKAISKIATSSAVKRHPGLDSRMDLVDRFSRSPRMLSWAMKVAERYPDMREAFRAVYGVGFFSKCARLLTDRFIRPVDESMFKVARGDYDGDPNVAEPINSGPVENMFNTDSGGDYNGDTVKVYLVRPDDALSAMFMSDEDRERLARGKAVIMDKRPDDQITQVIRRPSATVCTPTETGMYDVLLRDGTFRRCAVITEVHPCTQEFTGVVNVISDDRSDFMTADREMVLVRPNPSAYTEYQTWYDKCPDKKVKYIEIDTGKEDRGLYDAPVQMAITRDGRATAMFSARHMEGMENGVHSDWQDVRYRPAHKERSLRFQQEVTSAPYNYDIEHVVTLPEDDVCMYISGRELFIPNNHKSLQIDGDSESSIITGTIDDLNRLYFEKAASATPVSISYDGCEVKINDLRPCSYRSALNHLVFAGGLREKDAEELLKEAQLKGQHNEFVYVKFKFAAPYQPQSFMVEDMTAPISAPVPPTPTAMQSDEWGDALLTSGQEVAQVIPGLESQRVQDPVGLRPDYAQTMQMASDAAQRGQKDIFDTGVLGSFLKDTRDLSIVDEYMVDLMRALDRLGRLLFHFYWHNKDFAERFGQSDMKELEGSLKSAFETLGDLCLYLRQKDVSPLPSLESGSMLLGGETAEF